MIIYKHDNIYCIENLLSDDEINVIQSKINCFTFLSAPAEYSFYSNVDSEVHLILKKNHNKIKNFIEDIFNCRIRTEDCATINKYISGWNLAPHDDSGPTNSGGETTDFSSIIYFNENFTGGQLTFINQNLTIQPKKGMAIFSPATPEYLHEVSTVISGERYTATVFWQKE